MLSGQIGFASGKTAQLTWVEVMQVRTYGHDVLVGCDSLGVVDVLSSLSAIAAKAKPQPNSSHHNHSHPSFIQTQPRHHNCHPPTSSHYHHHHCHHQQSRRLHPDPHPRTHPGQLSLKLRTNLLSKLWPSSYTP